MNSGSWAANLYAELAGAFQVFNKEAAAEHLRVKQERDAARQKLGVLQRQSAQLTVRAPISGVVADMAQPLAAGEWLAQGEWLAVIAKPGGGLVEAFVSEKDWQRLRTGGRGHFILVTSVVPRCLSLLRISTIPPPAI